MSAANDTQAVCDCFRKDHDDPLGQIPASVKLEQVEAILLLYQFLDWGRTHNAQQVNAVRLKLCESLGWGLSQFEACMADVLKMQEGFKRATDVYVREADTTPRLVLPRGH